jgi:hypothetical protein
MNSTGTFATGYGGWRGFGMPGEMPEARKGSWGKMNGGESSKWLSLWVYEALPSRWNCLFR